VSRAVRLKGGLAESVRRYCWLSIFELDGLAMPGITTNCGGSSTRECTRIFNSNHPSAPTRIQSRYCPQVEPESTSRSMIRTELRSIHTVLSLLKPLVASRANSRRGGGACGGSRVDRPRVIGCAGTLPRWLKSVRRPACCGPGRAPPLPGCAGGSHTRRNGALEIRYRPRSRRAMRCSTAWPGDNRKRDGRASCSNPAGLSPLKGPAHRQAQ